MPPPPLRGSLNKKSGKGFLGRDKWDSRFIEVVGNKVIYWKSSEKKEGPQGELHLGTTVCEVIPTEGSTTLFCIRPTGDKWLEGSFMGADAAEDKKGKTLAAGREFIFDAAKSEHERSVWLQSIAAHIKNAAGTRSRSTTMASSSSVKR